MTSRCRWARRLFATGVLACVIGLMPATAAAQTVTLAWDPVPDPSVAGYLLYIGTQSGVYTETQDVGNRTTFVYTIGQPSRTHYFAVAA